MGLKEVHVTTSACLNLCQLPQAMSFLGSQAGSRLGCSMRWPKQPGEHTESLLTWVHCTGHLQRPPSPPLAGVICNFVLSFFFCFYFIFELWCGFLSVSCILFPCSAAAPSGFVSHLWLGLLANSKQRDASSVGLLNHLPFQRVGKYLSFLEMFA